jgi:DNA invertase Pin-like site-specific DNA recombinase
MTKITAAHPARTALVFASRRASSFSTIPRAGAASMVWSTGARALGCSGVEVIGDDLGRSSSGIARPGFEKLLAAICEDRVGAVVSIKPSPLARNWCYWQNLIEFCGLVSRRIVDEDSVYDPRHRNDRLLLGLNGIVT